MSDTFMTSAEKRGLIAQVNHRSELEEHLNLKSQTAYVGIDPTGPSLHVGHLLPTMQLARWQRSGHQGIVLMGGGTARIGDPTGKTSIRPMLEVDVIQNNIDSISKQIRSIFAPDRQYGLDSNSSFKIVDNYSWLKPLQYLDFLREYGRHFSVNRMLAADCFKTRLETGLSFLEFNYMLLQAYDFLHLFETHDCTVELGGDDQWSNMLAGADLIRRIKSSSAYCLTFPLLTTPDGRKMGKTEGGAIWLDPTLTPPFDYFQYWRNQPDEMIAKLFNYFTFTDPDETKELTDFSKVNPNESKERLAFEATAIVHGEEEAQKARDGARQLFSSAAKSFQALSGRLPTCDLTLFPWHEQKAEISELLVFAKIVASKSEARRLIKQGGLVWGDKKIEDEKASVDEAEVKQTKEILLRKGKKAAYILLF